MKYTKYKFRADVKLLYTDGISLAATALVVVFGCLAVINAAQGCLWYAAFDFLLVLVNLRTLSLRLNHLRRGF